MLRGAVRAGLELFLEQELEDLIGAEWYARVDGRRDYRNGRYGRQVLTSLGRVEVAVPRARSARAPRAVLTRYQRRSPDVDALLLSAYLHGVSTRQAGELTTALLGERVSRATVSRVTQALETTVAQLRGGRIEGPQPYLFLDATFVNARWARAVENVSAPGGL
jgi:transposase-like protein